MTNNVDFEKAFARLEEILQHMNSGALSLDTLLALYEEGDALIKQCGKKLSNVETKIEILIKNREGELAKDEMGAPLTQPFDVDHVSVT